MGFFFSFFFALCRLPRHVTVRHGLHRLRLLYYSDAFSELFWGVPCRACKGKVLVIYGYWVGLMGVLFVQISTSVRGGRSASVETASAQIHGVDTVVNVEAICSISVSMTHASVSLSFTTALSWISAGFDLRRQRRVCAWCIWWENKCEGWIAEHEESVHWSERWVICLPWVFPWSFKMQSIYTWWTVLFVYRQAESAIKTGLGSDSDSAGWIIRTWSWWLHRVQVPVTGMCLLLWYLVCSWYGVVVTLDYLVFL